MKHPKWIIENDRLIIGKANFHFELAKDKNKVRGGGWFDYLDDEDGFLLYGSSSDFGSADHVDVAYAVLNGFCDAPYSKGIYNNHKFYFSPDLKLFDACKSQIELKNPNLLTL